MSLWTSPEFIRVRDWAFENGLPMNTPVYEAVAWVNKKLGTNFPENTEMEKALKVWSDMIEKGVDTS